MTDTPTSEAFLPCPFCGLRTIHGAAVCSAAGTVVLKHTPSSSPRRDLAEAEKVIAAAQEYRTAVRNSYRFPDSTVGGFGYAHAKKRLAGNRFDQLYAAYNARPVPEPAGDDRKEGE